MRRVRSLLDSFRFVLGRRAACRGGFGGVAPPLKLGSDAEILLKMFAIAGNNHEVADRRTRGHSLERARRRGRGDASVAVSQKQGRVARLRPQAESERKIPAHILGELASKTLSMGINPRKIMLFSISGVVL